jgi:large repetitive protein
MLVQILPSFASAASAAPKTGRQAPTWILPATGALFGGYPGYWNGDSDRQTRVKDLETLIGRKIAVERVFNAWDDAFPTADDNWSRDQGHILILSWGAGKRDGSIVPWADIAAGLYDADIDARAAGIMSFGAPMIFVFHHEPNGQHIAGTPQEFIDAFQHVHDRFIADGVTNVLYGMVMFDSAFNTGQINDYYPGDSYVDVVGVDAYNWYQCEDRNDPWESLETNLRKFHDFGVAHAKPLMIAEWGSDEDPADPLHKGEWITEAAATIKTWPEVKAVAYFHSGPPAPTCNWWIDSTPASLAAFQAMGADPYFNPPPPLVTVTSGPSDPSNLTSPSFEFASNVPGSTFTCSVDGGAPADCSSGYAFTGLVDGSHTATITATDPPTGESGYTTYPWSIDTVPPTATFVSTPPAITNLISATFKFSSSESSSTFTCQLDSGLPATCTSPITYDQLGNASHTFVVTTTDPAGNVSAPATWIWTVDTVAPVATINSGPPNPSNSKSPTFTFSSNEPGGVFKCSVDGAAYSACVTPKTYSSVTDGSHAFSVEAIDSAGNISAPTTWPWTVDTVKPYVTITSQPANPSKSNTASFIFTVADSLAVTSTCQLDVGAAAPCGAGAQAGYAHDSFSRALTDNWGTSDTGQVWAYSNGAQVDFDADGSAGTVNLPTANVPRTAYLPQAWTDQETLARFSVNKMPTNNRVNAYVLGRYDPAATGPFYTIRAGLLPTGTMMLASTKKPAGGAEAQLGTELNLGSIGLANTWYWVRARFVNENGSVRIQGRLWKDGTPEPTTWQFSYLDSSSPILTAGRAGVRGSPSGTNTPFLLSWDDITAQAGVTYPGLTDGSHTLLITSTDAAGNVGTATYTWTVDTVSPVATITSSPSNPSNSTSATFKFGSNETGSTFTCQLDSGTPAACTAPFTYTGLSNGSHTFRVTATDRAGNVSAAATSTWTVDTVAPTATITGGPPSLTNSKTATFTFTSNDPNATFKCSKDGGPYSSCTSPKVYTLLADGPHTFALTATDQAGNVSVAATWSWTVDATKPAVTLTGYPSDPSTQDTATFTFTASEPGVTFTCQLDSGTPATCTSPKTYTGISVAQHTFKVYATDPAGNVGTTITYVWRRI